MSILNDLINFRQEVKEQIIKTATEIYLKENDGLFPKWEEDEIILDGSNANNYKIVLMVGNTFDNNFILERQAVNEIRVTLDSNLYFITVDCDTELHWTEVYTDDLVGICQHLQRTLREYGYIGEF